VKALQVVFGVCLLYSVAAGQQNQVGDDRQSVHLRCSQVAQLERVLQQPRGIDLPPEILPDDVEQACRMYMVALDYRDDERSRRALNNAKEALDPSKLTDEELSQRLAQTLNAMDPDRLFHTLADVAKEAFHMGNQGQSTDVSPPAPSGSPRLP
jgi:hypothetical protein